MIVWERIRRKTSMETLLLLLRITHPRIWLESLVVLLVAFRSGRSVGISRVI